MIEIFSNRLRETLVSMKKPFHIQIKRPQLTTLTSDEERNIKIKSREINRERFLQS